MTIEKSIAGRPRQCPPCPQCGEDHMRSYGATHAMGLDATQTPTKWVKVVKSYYQCSVCGARAAWRKGQNQYGFWDPVNEKKECTVKEKMLKDIEKRLPDDYFGRAEAIKALRGLMTLSTLRYLDEKGLGPESSMFGGRRKYEKRSFLSWLDKRTSESTASAE